MVVDCGGLAVVLLGWPLGLVLVVLVWLVLDIVSFGCWMVLGCGASRCR